MTATNHRIDGDAVRVERERQGLRPEALALMLDCSVAWVAHVELGYGPTSAQPWASRFAEALEVPVASILRPVEDTAAQVPG